MNYQDTTVLKRFFEQKLAFKQSLRRGLLLSPSLLFGLFGLSLPTVAQVTNYRVVVNSNADTVQPDEALTLREAIEVVNGQLGIEQLSEAERAQIRAVDANTPSRIEFNLPPEQTTIQLEEMLPPLARPGLVVDGTTQPGYDATRSATAEIAIPIPIVAIAPTNEQRVLRGLTIIADRVTVRGLSLYGFGKPGITTLNTPPADILITDLSLPDVTARPLTSFDATISRPGLGGDADLTSVPNDVVIEDNWLGLPPNEAMPATPSAFGVWVFNGVGTIIRGNRIANHEGSGIITSIQAQNLQVTDNIIVGNGIAGMPDAIRLEGRIDDSQITGNLICGNDGSGVYLFKPQGSVQIANNQITFNGRRLRRAAVYLMGDAHQVLDNQIAYQAGPGVVVTAYPQSERNIIVRNRFAGLEGLSIDLNTFQNVSKSDFQVGDGPNPRRNSPNRRKETGNSAINAPQFMSEEFFILGSTATLLGQADPGSSVELYRVNETSDLIPYGYGPLSQPLATVETDAEGKFSATVEDLQPGERVSAIATHPEYGTSEPALNAVLLSPQGTVVPQAPNPTPVIPQCTSVPQPPAPPAPPPAPAPAPEPEPQPVILRVPTNVHFALDRSDISPESAAVLDQVAQVLREYPFLTVELQGHTDPRASAAYNLALGNRRALAVRNYLLAQGIDPARMTIRSFGEEQRRTTGTDVLDYARDRRVEILFQDVRGLEIIFEIQEEDLQLESTGGAR